MQTRNPQVGQVVAEFSDVADSVSAIDEFAAFFKVVVASTV
ncbi:Predicted Zn-dependent peptidase [Pseudomonas syringae pv. actinidiae]|uniref:Predicted Zn-dependent peptidase n=1 Tax=Pseudomonas syringae pv. actinidiae TaxID=103796 RepID=A0AAN4QC81_PSESF|nr:Predicted Zn-dependent peptidase [Pseudomonas syringae pv. actinidiae]